MKIWYEASDEGVHLGITRLIAPDDWTPESDTRVYPTWAEARHNAIERQRWVLRTGEYDPAKYADPAIECLWPERNDGILGEMREYIEGLLHDLEQTPEDARGFDVFETLRRGRLMADANGVPRTDVLAGAAVTHADVDRELFDRLKRECETDESACLPRKAEPLDVDEVVAVRDAISEGLNGYRGRCVTSGNEVTVVVEEAFARRLVNRVELHLHELLARPATLRFVGTMSPPPFRTPERAAAWVKRLSDLLMLDE